MHAKGSGKTARSYTIVDLLRRGGKKVGMYKKKLLNSTFVMTTQYTNYLLLVSLLRNRCPGQTLEHKIAGFAAYTHFF